MCQHLNNCAIHSQTHRHFALFRKGEDWKGHDRSKQARTGQNRSGKVKICQNRSGQIMTDQGWARQFRTEIYRKLE